MRVNTNMNAMIAHSNMTKNTALSGNSMEKISSGLRITKAGDDAAGLAISEKMRAQIKGMEQAQRNTQDGISAVQTAEGGMEEIGNIAQRMRELSVQASNETNSLEDRTKITTELKQLHSEIDRIAESTKFNGKTLLGEKVSTIEAGDTSILSGKVSIEGFATEAMKDVASARLDNDGTSLTLTLLDSEGNTIDLKDADGNSINPKPIAIADIDLDTTDGIQNDKVAFDFGDGNKITVDIAEVKSTTPDKKLAASENIAIAPSDTAPTATPDNGGVISASVTGFASASTITGATLTKDGDNWKLTLSDGTASTNTLAITDSDGNGDNGIQQSGLEFDFGVEGKITLAINEDIQPADKLLSDSETLELGKNPSDVKLNLQVGANTGASEQLEVVVANVSTKSLELESTDIDAINNADLTEGTKAAKALVDKLDKSLEKINTSRANLGATQNRLEYAQNNLTTSSENLTAAESRVRDVDVAKEMMNLSKLNILNQAAQAMMGQAKQQPEGVLQLLR